MTKIALVGEAYGEKEVEQGRPFVGTSGWLLDNFLAQVGIARSECLVTNVFNFRPERNDVKMLCGPKAEGIPNTPPLMPGKYVRREYGKELDRLYDEIRGFEPNIVVALGATAAWAFMHTAGIKGIRGATAASCPMVTARLSREYKILPTYHPAAVARDWTLRPIIMSDLDKAKRESEYPDVRKPRRELWIEPTLEDIISFEQTYFRPGALLSADIETWQRQITCIGFAPSSDCGIVIPFFSERYPDRNYWRTIEEELEAWKIVARWLRAYPTLFQNGMYDIQFLYRSYGIPVPLATEDTMLLHHAYQPEMEKGLGFLASIYTDEASWKFMRKGVKHD